MYRCSYQATATGACPWPVCIVGPCTGVPLRPSGVMSRMPFLSTICSDNVRYCCQLKVNIKLLQMYRNVEALSACSEYSLQQLAKCHSSKMAACMLGVHTLQLIRSRSLYLYDEVRWCHHQPSFAFFYSFHLKLKCLSFCQVGMPKLVKHCQYKVGSCSTLTTEQRDLKAASCECSQKQ